MPPREILEDFYFIERGFLNGNHYIYSSKAPVLIDTGFITHWCRTKDLIAGVGVEISEVSLIISTHCHCDHVGGNKLIQELSGCGVALHELGKKYMDTRDDWETWWRYFDQEPVFFDATRVLGDGEIIDIGPHSWEVIYTPGHARDAVALYNRAERLLISSDALWESDMPSMVTRIEGEDSLDKALESLDRLEGLDVKTVFPGHGPPFCDIASAIEGSRKRIKGYIDSPERVGRDIVKKAIVFYLLMKNTVLEDSFFPRLMDTTWYRDTCDRLLGGEYEGVYKGIMDDFIERGIVLRNDGALSTVVRP